MKNIKKEMYMVWYYIIISYDSRLSAGYISQRQSDDQYKSIIQRYALNILQKFI